MRVSILKVGQHPFKRGVKKKKFTQGRRVIGDSYLFQWTSGIDLSLRPAINA